MTPKPFDPTKPVRTRDGREARVYATDGGGDYSIHGAFRDWSGTWLMCCWNNDGKWRALEEAGFDLVNVPERIQREGWMNVYLDPVYCTVWPTKEFADKYGASGSRKACIHITIDCEEGEGL